MTTAHISLRRGLVILEHLSKSEGLRFSELKKLTAFPDNTLSRLLTTLQETGYIENVAGMYIRSLNLAMDTVINIAHHRIIEAKRHNIKEIISKLSRKCKLSCGAMGQIGDMTMKIICKETMHHKMNNVLGRSFNFGVTGFEIPMVPYHGFAQTFLSFRAKVAQERSFNLPLWQSWSRKVSTDDYLKKFSVIKKNKYCIEDREQFSDLTRICVPVFLKDMANPVLVIGCIGPKQILVNKHEYLGILKRGANRICKLLTDSLQN